MWASAPDSRKHLMLTVCRLSALVTWTSKTMGWALYSNLTGGLPSLRLARLPSALAGSRFCALLTGYCRIDAGLS
jgi:hypothetical protein